MYGVRTKSASVLRFLFWTRKFNVSSFMLARSGANRRRTCIIIRAEWPANWISNTKLHWRCHQSWEKPRFMSVSRVFTWNEVSNLALYGAHQHPNSENGHGISAFLSPAPFKSLLWNCPLFFDWSKLRKFGEFISLGTESILLAAFHLRTTLE